VARGNRAQLARQELFKLDDHGTTEAQLTKRWSGKRMPRTFRRDYESNLPAIVTNEERLELMRRHALYHAKNLAPVIEEPSPFAILRRGVATNPYGPGGRGGNRSKVTLVPVSIKATTAEL